MEEVQLETARLLLRMWREEDFEPYAKMCEDEDIMRYIGGKPLNRLEAWRHFAYLFGLWLWRGSGIWAVE
jgi:RimJ/RimL family protein N-acetyltransferase